MHCACPATSSQHTGHHICGSVLSAQQGLQGTFHAMRYWSCGRMALPDDNPPVCTQESQKGDGSSKRRLCNSLQVVVDRRILRE